jgi:type IV pilus biogenesis protein PilP
MPPRDPFAFGGAEEPERQPVRPRPAAPAATPAPTPTPTPPLVRLVGLVGRGGQIRAALAIGGDVLIAASGEDVDGYQVLSVDPELGVRLRMPDGSEITLEPPSE